MRKNKQTLKLTFLLILTQSNQMKLCAVYDEFAKDRGCGNHNAIGFSNIIIKDFVW